MVEGTPLLREHAVMSCIEGSNPSASANPLKPQMSDRLGLFSLAVVCRQLAGLGTRRGD